jgi:uncharacterized protein (DUF4415 family)
MSEKATGTNSRIVKFTLDPEHLPELSEEQKTRLDAIADGDIDFSDLPPQIGVSWTRPGALVPTANKRSTALRLDEDVLAFFKSTGKRYQTRINAVLRAYMKAHDGKGGNVE